MSKRKLVGRLFIFNLVLLFLFAGATSSPALGVGPSRPDQWHAVDSENFHIITDAGRSGAAKIAIRLEALREVLRRQGYAAIEASSAPTTIIVFRRSGDLDDYGVKLFEQEVPCIGFSLPYSWSNAVVVDGRVRREDVFDSVFRGYVQLVLSHSPSFRPLWFRTGVAEFYRTLALRQDVASFGERIDEYAVLLRTQRDLPIDRLLSLTSGDFRQMSGKEQDLFTAQSWALVHYLFVGGDERKIRGRAFLQAQADGQSVESAFQASFKDSTQELGKQLEDYIDRSRMAHQQMKLTVVVDSSAVTKARLGRADLLAELGLLLVIEGDAMESAAAEHLLGALEIESTHPKALAGLALLRDRQGRGVEAEGLYQLAVSAKPDTFLPYYLFARHLQLESSVFDPDHSVPWCEIRSLLVQAIERRPEFFEARLALAASYLDQPGSDAAEGIVILEQAIAMRPGRSDLRLGLALLYLREGKTGDAQQQLAEVQSWGEQNSRAGNAHLALSQSNPDRARDLLASEGLKVFDEQLNAAIGIARTPAPNLSFENPLRPRLAGSSAAGR